MSKTASSIQCFFLLILSLLPIGAVQANDSTAVLAAGGLRLEKSSDISILSEKLRISPNRIVVDYEMRNISAQAVETIVAFPLPLLEGPELTNVPVEVDSDHPDNFVDFRTTIDGETVETERQLKAFRLEPSGELGREVSFQLDAASILISFLDRGFSGQLAELGPEKLQKLQDSKLLEVFESGPQKTYTPLWALEYTYFSKVNFPPGKLLRIHHEYAPVVGRSLFGKFSFNDDLKSWCVDGDTQKALRKMIGKRPVTGGWTKIVERKQVDYILKTGANWAGPIRNFELTVEKEHPAQIVSLCAEGMKRVSETEFRMVRKNFVPKEDISILFFEPSVNDS